jgi:hypothetical protein
MTRGEIRKLYRKASTAIFNIEILLDHESPERYALYRERLHLGACELSHLGKSEINEDEVVPTHQRKQML